MHQAWQDNDLAGAMRIQDRLVPLHDSLFAETSPGPVKYAASLLGHGSSHCRLPLAPVVDERSLGTGLRLTLDEPALGKTAAQVIEELRTGSPSIWVRGSGNSFNVAVTNLVDGDEQIVARRLRESLAR